MTEQGLYELPSTWTVLNVGESIKKIPISKKKLKKGDYLEKGEIPVIDQGQIFIGGYTNNHNLKIENTPLIIFGDHTRCIKFIDFDFVPGADGVKVFKPLPFFYPKLFHYFLQTIKLPNKGYARHFQFLEKSLIPLPPFNEQKRIVNKIEEIFTRLDAGVGELEKIKQQLKVYRQSLLKNAFNGKLTEEWREVHNEQLEPASELMERIKKKRRSLLGKKYKELPSADESELIKLPESWIYTRLGEVCDITMGQSPPGRSYNTEGIGTPLINGPVEFGPMAFSKTIKSKFTTEPKKMCKENDLILCVRGSTTGRMNIAGFDACIGRGVASISSIINQEYLNWLIHFKQREIYNKGTGSTFPNINQTALKELIISMPSIEEQEKISNFLNIYSSLIEHINENIKVSLLSSKQLRQSILKKAFLGQLVAQSSEDEPARALLERITAEKEENKPKRKRKTMKKKDRSNRKC